MNNDDEDEDGDRKLAGKGTRTGGACQATLHPELPVLAITSIGWSGGAHKGITVMSFGGRGYELHQLLTHG